MLCIAIVNKPGTLPGKLCRWVTGLADMHVLFCDPELDLCWDQDLLFRRRKWSDRYSADEVTLFQCPFTITPTALDAVVIQDVFAFCRDRSIANVYGFRDYLGFIGRKLGLRVRNYGGVVCSGRVRDIAYSCGFNFIGTPEDLEPSPADWRRLLVKLGVHVVQQGRAE